MDILNSVSLLFALIVFGYVLQRANYFEEATYKKLLHFTLSFVIPSMLFATFMEMEISPQYALISFSYSGFMLLLLVVGFLLQKIFKFRHRFFPLLLTSLGFGTVAFPLYMSIFGEENAHYMAVIGVGHEIFIAVVYLPVASMYLSGKKFSLKNSFRSPFLIMVVLALFFRLAGLDSVFHNNPVGVGIYGAIRSLGSATLPLAMVLIGFRLRLANKKNLGTSIMYMSIRLAALFVVGWLFRLVLFDGLVGGNEMFIYAFNIMLFQHGSIAVAAMVGQYSPKEDQEIINNVFVLNVLIGFGLFLLYMIVF